ncbi:MAG TPA: class I SAM-dependent methyltransferase [Pseudolabrys sp.]|jgi:ubiquinone/menaquinone biosynthesis C-methylase UbiE|nr:class I SAM-dependent methyltransferase [Pseudolabrys sp.]
MVPPSQDVISVYERHSLQWDRDRVRALFERSWLEKFAALLPDAAKILDLGCGTAEPIARYFIERGGTITGVDAAPSQIAQCRRPFPTQQWNIDLCSKRADSTWSSTLQKIPTATDTPCGSRAANHTRNNRYGQVKSAA